MADRRTPPNEAMPSPPAGRRALGLQERRARILAATKAALLAGAEATLSMRQLALDAGLSVATLYNLYGSKEAVLVGLLDDELERLFAGADEPTARRLAAGGDDTPASVRRCRALVETALARYTRQSALFRPLLGAVERQNANSPRTALIGRMTDLLAGALADGVAAGELVADLPVDLVARQVVRGFIHAIRYWSIGDLDDDGLRAQVRSVVDLALLALAAPATRPALTARLTQLAPRLRALADRPRTPKERS
jgi:AcrR family transcriptional regulator